MALTEAEVRERAKEVDAMSSEAKQHEIEARDKINEVAQNVYERLIAQYNANLIVINEHGDTPEFTEFSTRCSVAAMESAVIFGRNNLGYNCHRSNAPGAPEPVPEFSDDSELIEPPPVAEAAQ